MIEAAARVLSRNGPRGFTTNHVAEAAGISIGSLYQYFPNKQALVTAIRHRHVAESLAVIEKAAKHPGPLSEMAEELAAGLIAAHCAYPGLHRVLLETVPSAERLSAPGEDFERIYLDGYAKLAARFTGASLEDCRLSGTALADALDGLIHNAARRGIADPEPLRRHIVRLAVTFLSAQRDPLP